MSLSSRKWEMLLAEQSTTARKVYEFVPIEEMWSVQQIATAMTRERQAKDFRVIHGCLEALVECGLVREPRSNHYRREKVRPQETVEKSEEETMPAVYQRETNLPLPAAPEPASLTDRIGNLAARVVRMSADLKALSDDLTNIALDVEGAMEATIEQQNKMRQLKQMWETL